MRNVVLRETITGAIIGVIIGASFFAFALVAWGDASVAAAVGLALVACCSIATLVAMSLPWLFQRLGFDPAFGSGPLATVVLRAESSRRRRALPGTRRHRAVERWQRPRTLHVSRRQMGALPG